jgi:dihydrofolate reductase
VIISLIAAMDEKRGIGWKGKIPWRLSSDLKRFRELTMGHHIIVGRKTFESIGRPLPGRQTIIVTRNPDFTAEGCLVVHSLDEAINLAKSRGESEAFICGGARIYAEAITRAQRFYLTIVHAQVESDTLFPEWDEGAWTRKQSSHREADDKDEYSSTFALLEAGEGIRI